MMKNMFDFCVGTVVFWLVGFGLMFGATQGFIGTTGFAFEGKTAYDWAFLFFQTVFCATAATIVSGAMAERTKFGSYLLYTAGITAIVYPIFGSWCWNGLYDTADKGWLEAKGFHDFAGSTVVHSIGGWCALAGAIVVGSRLGKYGKDGKVKPIPGHNIPLAAMGVFILWLGWFGFNPGSTTAISGGNFAYIAITTNMAAATGALGALFFSWILFKKPDTSFALNGALAGLVTVTAGCDVLSVGGAALAGAIGGCLCVLAVLFFDRIKVDDPVGAISVHGVCGAWGTLAVGLLASPTAAANSGQLAGLFYGGGTTLLIAQLWGVATAFVWAFSVSMGIFLLIKYTLGLRVSEQEELEGLDIHEHGMHAYPPSFVADTASGLPAFGASPSYGTAPAMAMSTSMAAESV
jgi:Amt family ammonium transporter